MDRSNTELKVKLPHGILPVAIEQAWAIGIAAAQEFLRNPDFAPEGPWDGEEDLVLRLVAGEPGDPGL